VDAWWPPPLAVVTSGIPVASDFSSKTFSGAPGVAVGSSLRAVQQPNSLPGHLVAAKVWFTHVARLAALEPQTARDDHRREPKSVHESRNVDWRARGPSGLALGQPAKARRKLATWRPALPAAAKSGVSLPFARIAARL
jgi:hypothetical protein